MDVARPWEGISIHAPLAGYDHLLGGSLATALIFQSTHPSRGATALVSVLVLPCAISIHAPLAGCDLLGGINRVIDAAFQSTHPSRGATGMILFDELLATISIHAPLAGCDYKGYIVTFSLMDFNPRTPRGVRQQYRRSNKGVRYFNPRTPRGVRPDTQR